MVYFQTKNPILGKFWRALELKSLVFSMAIWSILRTLGIFYGHLVILWQFGIVPPPLVHCVAKNLATLTSRGRFYEAVWAENLRMKQFGDTLAAEKTAIYFKAML
jgi:hypothetical protein